MQLSHGNDLILTNALKRAWRISSEIGAAAVIVDAKNERARDFYCRYGFELIVETINRLYVPMLTLERNFKS